MRHLIGIALFVAATAAYGLAWGPLFFGTPLLGSVLLLLAVGLEIGFWRRLARRPVASR